MGDEGEPVYGNLGLAEGGETGESDPSVGGYQQTPRPPPREFGTQPPDSPDAPMVPDRDDLVNQRDDARDEAARLKHFLWTETEGRLRADY